MNPFDPTSLRTPIRDDETPHQKGSGTTKQTPVLMAHPAQIVHLADSPSIEVARTLAIGDRVRIPCRPPHPDITGVVERVTSCPWCVELMVAFDSPVQGVGRWMWIDSVHAIREG